MITAQIQTEGARRKLKIVEAALSRQSIDPVVDRVALRTLTSVVKKTPKKWFGQVRRSWQKVHWGLGERVVKNDNKIMRFLEYGTANKGSGFIRPTHAPALFIPLTRKAALSSAESKGGLVYGRDYILAKKVRGIRPRLIVLDQARWSEFWMLKAAKDHVRNALRHAI